MPRRPPAILIDIDKAADAALLIFEALEEVRQLRPKQIRTVDIQTATRIVSKLDDALIDLQKSGIPVPQIPDDPMSRI